MKNRWLYILLGSVAFLLVLGIGAVLGGVVTRATLREAHVSPRVVISASEYDDEGEGVLISKVEVESPADRAGLVRGDILLEVNGTPVDTIVDLRSVLAKLTPGEPASLRVLHGDEELTLSATLGERDGQAYLGIEPGGRFVPGRLITRVPFEDAPFEFISSPGVFIAEIVPGSPADQAGLQKRDVILKVDNMEITVGRELSKLIEEHKPGDTIKLIIDRPGEKETLEISVVLDENPSHSGHAHLGVIAMPEPYFRECAKEPCEPFIFPDGFGPILVEPGWDWLPEGIDRAVIIGEVLADTPAEEAGLQAGDFITELDGKPVSKPDAFVEAVQGYKPGEQITLRVYRRGKDDPLEIQVTLVEHPEKLGKGYLGVELKGYFQRD